MTLAELEAKLAQLGAWRDARARRAVQLLSVEGEEVGPDDEVNLLALEVATQATSGAALRVDPVHRAAAEAIAARLGWDLLEPVSAASPEALAVARRRAFATAAGEEGRPTVADLALAGAFQQPPWVMVLLAVVAFGGAAALLLALEVDERHFGVALGGAGTVFLVALLWVSGARRARARLRR